mmetsp:Transcript_26136/g.23131  ORF Transcript_26136/g.23131 Transcript_26136/m.23131 type:complete len:134 (+) Transcript_26136:147-548(+)
MLSRSQFYTNSGVRLTNFKDEPQNINIQENNIQIAFSWNGENNFDILGSQYGSLSLSKTDYQFNNDTGSNIWSLNTTLNIAKCTEEQFPYNVSPNGYILYCFDKEELMKINELGDPQKLQTWFQVMAFRCADN